MVGPVAAQRRQCRRGGWRCGGAAHVRGRSVAPPRPLGCNALRRLAVNFAGCDPCQRRHILEMAASHPSWLPGPPSAAWAVLSQGGSGDQPSNPFLARLSKPVSTRVGTWSSYPGSSCPSSPRCPVCSRRFQLLAVHTVCLPATGGCRGPGRRFCCRMRSLRPPRGPDAAARPSAGSARSMVRAASCMQRGQRVPQYQCGAASLSRSGRWSRHYCCATSHRSLQRSFRLPEPSLSRRRRACGCPHAGGGRLVGPTRRLAAPQSGPLLPLLPLPRAAGVYTADITYEDLQAKFTMVSGLSNASCRSFPYCQRPRYLEHASCLASPQSCNRLQPPVVMPLPYQHPMRTSRAPTSRVASTHAPMHHESPTTGLCPAAQPEGRRGAGRWAGEPAASLCPSAGSSAHQPCMCRRPGWLCSLQAVPGTPQWATWPCKLPAARCISRALRASGWASWAAWPAIPVSHRPVLRKPPGS